MQWQGFLKKCSFSWRREIYIYTHETQPCVFFIFLKNFLKFIFYQLTVLFLILNFGQTPWNMGSYFPVQGTNSHPWHCKAGGLLGKSPPFSRFNRDICCLLRCSLIGWLKAYDFGSRLPEWKPCCIFTGCVSLSKWIKLCSAYLPVKREKQWCPTHRTDCEDYMCHYEENTATPGRGEHTLRLASTAATDRKFPEGQGFSVSV